jgi:hypothetical protein
MYEHKYLQDGPRPTFRIMAFGTTAINIKAMLEMFKNGPCLIKYDKPSSPDVPRLLLFT